MRLLLPPTSTTLAVAIATSNSVSLSWTLLSDFDFQTPDFDSYQIFRDTNSGVDTNDTPIATITSTSTLIFTDTNLSPNTTFFYKLFVFDKAGLSTESNEVSATTLSAVSRLGIKASIPIEINPVSVKLSPDAGRIYAVNSNPGTSPRQGSGLIVVI